MHLQLSNELGDIINYAKEEAMRTGSYTITTDHLILGMIRQGENSAYRLLQSLGINLYELKREIESKIQGENMIPMEQGERIILSKASENALKIMFLEARSLHKVKPDATHLLLAVLRGQDSVALELLEERNASYERLRNVLSGSAPSLPDEISENTSELGELFPGYDGPSDPDRNEESASGEENAAFREGKIQPEEESGNGRKSSGRAQQPSEGNDNRIVPGSVSATPVLDSFGYDLTKAAREGKLDPVAGREKEIERLAQILGRRKKNNPVLIGEPGVGKSAIAEGLALRIARRNVSRALLDKQILSLDIGSIVAGTKYRGQFEERMKAILNEMGKNPNIILFIDEMHTLVGAGGAAGSLDAANMLKPALARGEIQCIGATTLDEYRQFIEKDGALERRFQKIMVEPTNFEQTLSILENIRERYEKHHNVRYTPGALKMCISLSERYISDRCLPDKAIDMMDEAGSRVRLKNMRVSKHIIELEKAVELLREEKQQAVAASDFKQAALFRDLEKNKTEELSAARRKWQKRLEKHPNTVDTNDVAEVLSMATNIPVYRIAESEGNRLMHMSDILRERVIGQDEAVEKVVRAIRRNRAGLKDPNKPIGTFLFLGPTGVGKTQLAKELARYLFDSSDSLIRIDMSEYMEKYSVSRLIGAPPGYVGYDEGGQLSEQVRRKPYSVVLLDEIEKAHPDIFNLLLQVLDEGRLTDSNGRRIDFRNTVLILTSNIGTKELKEFGRGLGYSNSTRRDTNAAGKEIIDKALSKVFTPEFLNRLDEQILFNTLTKENIEQIIDIELRELYDRVGQAGYKLKMGREVKKFVADTGYNPQYGARPLKRAIQRHIEDPIAEAIIGNRVIPGQTIRLHLNKEKNEVLAD